MQDATAVAGPSSGCLDTLQGCNLLPVTFPVTVFACTNTGKTLPVGSTPAMGDWAIHRPADLWR